MSGRLTMAIFRFYMKYILSSYTNLIWVVYMERAGGEVGARSRMCHRGWEVWVLAGILLLYVMTKLIQLGLWYHIVCVVELYSCVKQVHTLHFRQLVKLHNWSNSKLCVLSVHCVF
jgi:hypothetical protein